MKILHPSISPAERQVLRVVWANPQTTSQFIIQSLTHAHNWQASTIKTLINRLLKKGVLQAETAQKPYKYTAVISEQEQIIHETQQLLANICDRKKGEVLQNMISSTTLSQQDILVLQQLLVNKQQQAPETLSCNCLAGQCTCHHH